MLQDLKYDVMDLKYNQKRSKNTFDEMQDYYNLSNQKLIFDFQNKISETDLLKMKKIYDRQIAQMNKEQMNKEQIDKYKNDRK